MNEENISWENIYNTNKSRFGIDKKKMIYIIININLKKIY